MRNVFFVSFFIMLSQFTSPTLVAQDDDTEIYSHSQITRDVHLIHMPDGQSLTLVVGAKELFLFEAYYGDELVKGSNAKILAEIREISNLPVKYVMNSHSHPDHIGANEFFSDQGATVILQENFRYWPTYYDMLFSDRITIPLGNEEVSAFHVPGHSFDSTVVHLPKNNVILMGETMRTDWIPSTGPGGIAGELATIDMALALTDDNTIIVPSHGTPLDKKGLQEMRARDKAIADRIGALHSAGMSVEEIAVDKELNDLAKLYPMYSEYGQHLNYHAIEIVTTSLTEPHTVPAAKRATMLGTYSLGDKTLQVTERDDWLVAQAEGKFLFGLLPISEEKFLIVGPSFDQGQHMTFKTDASGATVMSMQGNTDHFFTKHLPNGEWVKQ